MLLMRSFYTLCLLFTCNVHIFSLEKIQEDVVKEDAQKSSNKKITLNVNYNSLDNKKYREDSESLKLPEQKKAFDWKATANLEIN